MSLKFNSSRTLQNIDIKNIVYGIITILFGISLYKFGPFFSRGYQIENTLGTLFCLLGTFVILSAIFGRKRYQEFQIAKMECDKCGKIYLKKDIHIELCSKCDGNLVDIEMKNATPEGT